MESPQLTSNAVIDGKYSLVRQLGEGGIGTVWLGWQELVQRQVAVKFLKGEIAEEQRDRFLLEARALGRLNHPNCITIFDFGWSEAHAALYLVMEFLDGEPLSDWRGRNIPFGDVLQISKQIANALAYAHHQTVYHRDLKPENVMLVPTFTGELLVKVLDFGLARLGVDQDEGPRLTQTGEIFGTPAYMSPEQIRGTRHAGAASDVYSLGIMMYEMIERRLPFDEATSFDLMMAHMVNPIPPMRRRDVPPDLARIVMKCVEKDQRRRYQSALELWEALSALDGSLGEESSVTFAAVASPSDTIDSPPPAYFPKSDYESTLEDEVAQNKPRIAATSPIPLDDAGNAQLPTVMMTASPGRQTTADMPTQSAEVFDMRQAALIVFTGLATLGILSAFLFLVVGADDTPQPKHQPAPELEQQQVAEPPRVPEEKNERVAPVERVEKAPTKEKVPTSPDEVVADEPADATSDAAPEETPPREKKPPRPRKPKFDSMKL